MLDYGSILLAAALSGVCLTTTLASIWVSARHADYVLTMAAGIFVLVVHIGAFWLYEQSGNQLVVQVALLTLVVGFLLINHSTSQYLKLDVKPYIAVATVAAAALCSVVTALGFDGAGFALAYATSSCLLALTATAFWTNGNQDHKALTAVSVLGVTCSVSFALCAGVLVWNGQWSLGTTPDNWAERINTVVAVVSMTALGALTISLHNGRTQNALIMDSMTDPLTGLLNRRALDKLYGQRGVSENTAVALFDLDHFKKTNDVFGHPVGDLVLQRFADVLRRHQMAHLEAFRLGGEEFAIVISWATTARALAITERIATVFGSEVVSTPLGPLRSSVSAGVALGSSDGSPITMVIAQADEALYEAKRAGRNRVVMYGAVGMGETASDAGSHVRVA